VELFVSICIKENENFNFQPPFTFVVLGFHKKSNKKCSPIENLTNSVAQEPEGSSPHSQQPATGPYPEPVESNPHPQTNLPKIHSDPFLPPTLWFLKIYQYTKSHDSTFTCATRPPQKFERPLFWNGLSYGIKSMAPLTDRLTEY
jgi:hypothetical protein